MLNNLVHPASYKHLYPFVSNTGTWKMRTEAPAAGWNLCSLQRVAGRHHYSSSTSQWENSAGGHSAGDHHCLLYIVNGAHVLLKTWHLGISSLSWGWRSQQRTGCTRALTSDTFSVGSQALPLVTENDTSKSPAQPCAFSGLGETVMNAQGGLLGVMLTGFGRQT